ncbi:DUF928 domain-containing protein [Coleofasciculus sp.]|uniref:DUF928 domain-containing protein n=1 Tax=Coleofasciculus sp. TaxID=3100458 RepID=UPI003A37B3BB
MKIKSLAGQILLVSALTFPLVDSVINPPQVQAQSVTQRIGSLFSSQKKLGTASGRSRGGAIRGECPAAVDKSIIALGPENNLGSTLKADPTLLFYMPYAQSMGVKYGRFVLLDEAGNFVLQQPIFVELPENPGIVRFTPPTTESVGANGKSIEVGKQYQWVFSVICNPEQPAGNPTVSGWIKRVAPSPELENQLEQKSTDTDYLTYLNHGIWYEAINQLAQNRDAYSEDWAGLLNHYDLSEFTQSSIGELRPVTAGN